MGVYAVPWTNEMLHQCRGGKRRLTTGSMRSSSAGFVGTFDETTGAMARGVDVYDYSKIH